jgi:hypothetical protein
VDASLSATERQAGIKSKSDGISAIAPILPLLTDEDRNSIAVRVLNMHTDMNCKTLNVMRHGIESTNSGQNSVAINFNALAGERSIFVMRFAQFK